MSILRPDKGLAVTIGGVQFSFLFTFAAIDELQSFYHAPMGEIMAKLTDRTEVYAAAGHIVEALIRSDLYNNGENPDKGPKFEEIMHVLDIKDGPKIIKTILTAYGMDMPEDEDEDDEDEDDGQEQLNLTRLLVIARTELKMSEDEFWKITPRKYFKLFEEYMALKGGTKDGESDINALP